MFDTQPGPKFISVQFNDGTWVGGLFGPDSYASPRRADHRELYLERVVELDSDGRPVVDDATQTPKLGDHGVLLVKLETANQMRVFDVFDVA
jgi:hypothetical protein